MRSIALAAATLGAAIAAMPARAATDPRDPAHAAYLAAYNQLGILEYCEQHGYVDASVVELQTRMMSLLPTPTDASGAAEAQAAGRDGTIEAGEQTMSIADASAGEGTAETVCAEIGDAVTSSGEGSAD
jgi:hypothetical protein